MTFGWVRRNPDEVVVRAADRKQLRTAWKIRGIPGRNDLENVKGV